VVNKEARVVEEIRLAKEVDEHNETIRDTVRHTEVDVDHIEDNSGKSDRNM
jgi:stress response protein YsnF